jgi:hypothetical protein
LIASFSLVFNLILCCLFIMAPKHIKSTANIASKRIPWVTQKWSFYKDRKLVMVIAPPTRCAPFHHSYDLEILKNKIEAFSFFSTGTWTQSLQLETLSNGSFLR